MESSIGKIILIKLHCPSLICKICADYLGFTAVLYFTFPWVFPEFFVFKYFSPEFIWKKYIFSPDYQKEFYQKNETWTSASPWKKETIDDINTLIRCLICNARARNRFEIKLCDQTEDVTYQLHRSWNIPSARYNFIPCQEVEQKEGTNFCHVKLGQ